MFDLSQSWDWFGGAIVGWIIPFVFGYITNQWQSIRRRHRLVAAITCFQPDNHPLTVIGSPLCAHPGSAHMTELPSGSPLFGYGPLISYVIIATCLVSAQRRKKAPTLPKIVVPNQFQHFPTITRKTKTLYY
jgi:hypothetical protein